MTAPLLVAHAVADVTGRLHMLDSSGRPLTVPLETLDGSTTAGGARACRFSCVRAYLRELARTAGGASWLLVVAIGARACGPRPRPLLPLQWCLSMLVSYRARGGSITAAISKLLPLFALSLVLPFPTCRHSQASPSSALPSRNMPSSLLPRKVSTRSDVLYPCVCVRACHMADAQ